jgi:type I restriction enzyme S subunit
MLSGGLDMVSNNKILGNYITRVDHRNVDKRIRNVMGISVRKEFRVPTSKVNPNELSTYKIVEPGQFAFVQTTHNEKCFAFAYNDTNKQIVVSSVNEVFYVDEKYIHPRYLQMFLNRSSFDRYARFNSWGSAREVFSWDDLCAVEIEIPPINIQRKYVDIYMAMVANQQSYERGLEDLKLVCDGYIEDLRRKMPCEKIGQYIERHDVRNGPNGTKNVMGISTSKCFREPTSKVNKDELANYKVCRPRQIGFVQTTHNEKVFTYAFNNTDEDIVVSSVNEVFSTQEDKLYPEYLCMFFNRTEFDRYARFHSWGSARETFTWSDLIEVEIPIPDIEIQKSIASVYSVYVKRKEINEQLKAQIKDICPILIRGSLEEGKA